MIDKNEILQLAKYSRLEFSDEELPKLLEDLENLMKFTSKVAQYNGDDVCHDCILSSYCILSSSSKKLNPSYPECSRSELLQNGSTKNNCFYLKK